MEHIAGRKSDLLPVLVGLWPGCPLSPVLFRRTKSRGASRGQRGSSWELQDFISACADDVQLAPSGPDMKKVLTFSRFWAAKCEAAGMRIGTSRFKAMVLDQNRPQVEESNCPGLVQGMREGWCVRLTDGSVLSVCCGQDGGEPEGGARLRSSTVVTEQLQQPNTDNSNALQLDSQYNKVVWDIYLYLNKTIILKND